MRTVTLNDGKEYPIHFDFNSVADIQDRFGNIEKLPEKMKSLKELRWIVFTAINEGIAKRNYDIGSNEKPVTEFEIGLKMPIDPQKMQEIASGIVNAFYDAVGGRKNAESIAAQAGTTLPNSTEETSRKA